METQHQTADSTACGNHRDEYVNQRTVAKLLITKTFNTKSIFFFHEPKLKLKSAIQVDKICKGCVYACFKNLVTGLCNNGNSPLVATVRAA